MASTALAFPFSPGRGQRGLTAEQISQGKTEQPEKEGASFCSNIERKQKTRNTNPQPKIRETSGLRAHKAKCILIREINRNHKETEGADQNLSQTG